MNHHANLSIISGSVQNARHLNHLAITAYREGNPFLAESICQSRDEWMENARIYSNSKPAGEAALTYFQTLDAYRSLLENHPDKLLKVGDGCVALLADGKLLTAPISTIRTGFKLGKAVEFEQGGWDEEMECWDGDVSSSETLYSIEHPEFLAFESGAWTFVD